MSIVQRVLIMTMVVTSILLPSYLVGLCSDKWALPILSVGRITAVFLFRGSRSVAAQGGVVPIPAGSSADPTFPGVSYFQAHKPSWLGPRTSSSQ